jgi:hypothetical protein
VRWFAEGQQDGNLSMTNRKTNGKRRLWQSGKDYPDEHGDGSPSPCFGQYPPWLGDEAFHASHRSNLLRKNPEWYGQFGWTEPDDLPYVWPVGKR